MNWVKHTLISGAALLLGYAAGAQAIDNTWSYKNISNDRYIRVNYENDFFSAFDRYYTQGVVTEVVSPAMKKNPLTKILVHPDFGYIRYGLAVEHEGYTPTNIDKPDILANDRPYAACWFLKTFQIAIDTIHRQRFSTSLSTGVIGPAALGGEMQTTIHRALNNLLPRGWHNQVQNDLILNYQVNYERQLVAAGKFFSLDADGMVRAGTLSDKASVGTTIIFGYFDSPFGSSDLKGNQFRIYAYEHPEICYVAYDATLEGGVFDRSSPYTISPNDMLKFVLQNRFGFVLAYRRVYLEYFQSYISAEFATGNYHPWGGIQVGVGL